MTEIVVTAEKRSESAQTVPIAIDVFNGDALASQGVAQINDLAAFSPNITAKNAVGNTAPIFAIRGVSLNDFATNGIQPVGVYLDDVYLVSNSQLSFQMFDLARVEVLKGPQGDLFGRNTTAGAVSFVTNHPTQHYEYGGNLTIGNYALVSGDAYVNAPISNNVSARLSVGGDRQFDGYFTNDLTGKGWGQTRRFNWRGQLAWNGDDSSVLLNVHGGIDHSDDWYYKFIADASGTPFGQQFQAIAETENPNIFHGDHTSTPYPYINNLSNGVSLTIDHDYGWSTVKSITGAELMQYARTEDYGSLPNYYGANLYQGHLSEYSEELRLASKENQRWNWIVGLFGSYDRINEGDVFNEVLNPLYLGYVFDVKYHQNTRSLAAFTHNDITITDQLKLVVGGRITRETRQFSGGTLIAQSDPAYAFDSCPCTVDTKLTYTEPTGKIGLDYSFDDKLLYASFSRGYKAGGVTGIFVTDSGALAPYQPEFINSYETGFKSTWLDKRLRINAALFHYDYSNLQAFGDINNEFRIFNVQQSRVNGAEIETNFLPFRGFEIDLGVGGLDTRVEKNNIVGVSVGNRLGNAPNIEIDNTVSYKWMVEGGMEAKVAIDSNFRGNTYTYVQNTALQHNPSYYLVNPRLSLSGPDNNPWKITAWCKNCTDHHYYGEIFNDASAVIGFPAAPRTFGVTLSYQSD